ncbi:MAG: DUF1957 domain-containing protein, partial [Chthoniobacterales bacterium]|nr:DUF1957 domain-containing protein [Chthoniobacterales bacterium]
PGHPAYREFYRDAGFDLPLERLGPVARGERKFSGLKYYRITGPGAEKDFYDPIAAKQMTAAQAADFFERRWAQLREIAAAGFDPIIVAPFDAELFGHWWFEGPRFLDRFIRKAAAEAEFSLTTPTQYLAAHPTQQIIAPAASSWGENGYFEVWLNETNAWLYPRLHVAAQRMNQLARHYAHDASPFADRVLKQLARELLLAQASDWPFLIKVGTAREYATKRANDHLARFNRLFDQFTANHVDETFLRDLEWRDNIFPDLNWRYYA